MSKIPKVTILFSIFYFLIFATAEAAEFYLRSEVVKNGNFSKLNLKVLVDSDEPLNAYKLSITYPEHLLRFENINDSRSIIDIWQSPRRLGSPGMIKIEGGSFAPFRGDGGEIATVEFLVVGAGTSELKFTEAAAYLADGLGTPAEVNTISSPLSIRDAGLLSPKYAIDVPAQELVEVFDHNPPEIKFFEVEPNLNLLIFLAKDGESGFDKALVRTKSWFRWGDWIEVASPVRLESGVWAIDFRAFDNAGNDVQKRLYLWNVLMRPIFALVFASFALVISLLLIVYRHRRKRN